MPRLHHYPFRTGVTGSPPLLSYAGEADGVRRRQQLSSNPERSRVFATLASLRTLTRYAVDDILFETRSTDEN